jgi:hypothetical protein
MFTNWGNVVGELFCTGAAVVCFCTGAAVVCCPQEETENEIKKDANKSLSFSIITI